MAFRNIMAVHIMACFVEKIASHVPLKPSESTGYGCSNPDNLETTFFMDDVECTGEESSLMDCNHLEESNCILPEVAEVVCPGN